MDKLVCLLFEDVNLGRKMELMHTILKSRLIACLHTAPAAAESFMLKGRFKLASLAFICFLSLSGCGNRMKDTDEKIPAAPQINANKLETETTGMDIYDVKGDSTFEVYSFKILSLLSFYLYVGVACM